jgi:hypothetical protein
MRLPGRYYLRDLLCVIAILSLILGMLSSESSVIRTLGAFLALPFLLGSINYLWSGRGRMEWGLLIGLFVGALVFATIEILFDPI